MTRKPLSPDAEAILAYLKRAVDLEHSEQLRYWKSIGEPIHEGDLSPESDRRWSHLYGRYDAAFDLLRGARRAARRGKR